MKNRILFILSIIILFSITAVPVYGNDHVEEEIGGEGYGENALLLELEILNFILLGISSLIIIRLILKTNQETGKITLGYIMVGIFLLALTRVFYIVADRGIISVADDTLEVWWHMIIFPSLIAFFIAGRRLILNFEGKLGTSFIPFAIFCGISTVVSIFVFSSAEILDDKFVEIFTGTFLAKLGIQHLIVFLLSSIVCFYLLETKESLDRGSAIISNSLLSFIIIFAGYHMWELITESLEIIVLKESVIEQVEQVFIIPMLIIFIYGFSKTTKVFEQLNAKFVFYKEIKMEENK